MAISISPSLEKSIEAEVRVQAETSVISIPTYVYATVFSSLCIAVGLIWDISWHMSIGRDGLLSPPHLSMYLGAIIAGSFSGFNVLKISFWGNAIEKAKKIKFWGVFYASLGALCCIWGAFAMLTSAPFDDWWHNTYGLDVKILSPPHAVLALGMIAIQFGAMFAVMSVQNRYKDVDNPTLQKRLRLLFALSSGFLLVMVYIIASEYFTTMDMHRIRLYQVASGLFPLFLIAISYSSPWKWGATLMTLIYSLLMMAMVWILPLFPAEPLLSPIYNPITQFQPYHFPILLIVPALAIDFLMIKLKGKNKWLLAGIFGLTFLAIFLPVQWHMGTFLHTSELAQGWFFGRFALPYFVNPTYPYIHAFNPDNVSSGLELWKGIGYGLLFGILSSRIGLSWGHWMSQIKR